MVILKPKIYKTIIIENISDNYARDYSYCSMEYQKYWETYDDHYGNRDLFYAGDNKVIISLVPMDPLYIKNTCELLGWTNILNIFPEKKSLSLTTDIITDVDLNLKVIKILRENPGISIIPLRQSKEFYALITRLKEMDLIFQVPEKLPNEVEFFRDYYDSKIGFRMLAYETLSLYSVPVQIPEGYIATSIDEIVREVEYLCLKGKDFVIKGNIGSQGNAVLIFNKQAAPYEKEDYIDFIRNQCEPLFSDNSSFIVEELIKTKEPKLYNFPSLNCYIKDTGEVEFLYVGYQFFKEDTNAYIGSYFCPKIKNDIAIKKAKKFILKFGTVIASYGYSGCVNIDVVRAIDDRVFAIEVNIRRGGAAYFYGVMHELYGENYCNAAHSLCIELRPQNPIKTDYAAVLKDFEDLIYTKEKNTGVILVSPDLIKEGMFTMVLIHKNKKLLFDLLEEVKRRTSL
jgi:hypothetical protein